MFNRIDESTSSSAPAAQTLGAHQVLASRFILQDLVYETPRERVYRAKDMRARQPVWVVFLQSKALSDLSYEAQSELAETVFSRQREIQSSCFCFSEFYGIYQDEVFVVYSIPEGIRLRQYLAEQKPNLSKLSELFQRILSVLGKAHACGIAHLDLNPDSIFISQSADEPLRIQIYGLGHAHLRGALGSNMSLMTKSGQTISQPEYLAPEVFSGKSADARSDLYSLGCLLYEAVTGAVPFSADSLIDLLLMHRQEPIPPMRGIEPSSPVVGLIRKLLAKQPEARPQHVHEAIDELTHCERIAVAADSPPTPIADNESRATEIAEPSVKILPQAVQNGAADYGRSVLSSRSLRPVMGNTSSRRSNGGWWVRGVFVLLVANLVAVAVLVTLFVFDRFSSRPQVDAQAPLTSEPKTLSTDTPDVAGILSRVDAERRGEAFDARASLGTKPPVVTDRPLPSEVKPTEFSALGFSALTVDSALASSMNLSIGQGVVVHSIARDSRAYAAGLRKRDVIGRVETLGENILVWRPQPISTIEELERAVGGTVERDTRLALIIRRGNFDGLVVFIAPLSVPPPGPQPRPSRKVSAKSEKSGQASAVKPEAAPVDGANATQSESERTQNLNKKQRDKS